MLRIFAKLLSAINSASSPAQLALGVVAGMFVGLTPLWTLSNLFITVLVFVLRINLSAFFLFWGLFSGVAYLIGPAMDWLGDALLRAGFLNGLWTAMYQSTFWRLTHYNNTLVLGALVISLILTVPVYLTCRSLIVQYRSHVLAWVRKTRLAQAIMATRFYAFYSHWSGR